jgi:hypothetical protein
MDMQTKKEAVLSRGIIGNAVEEIMSTLHLMSIGSAGCPSHREPHLQSFVLSHVIQNILLYELYCYDDH